LGFPELIKIKTKRELIIVKKITPLMITINFFIPFNAIITYT